MINKNRISQANSLEFPTQKSTVPKEVRIALQRLHTIGFANAKASREEGRHVITLYSTKEMFNANMITIVEITKSGILLRCRTSPAPHHSDLFRNMN